MFENDTLCDLRTRKAHGIRFLLTCEEEDTAVGSVCGTDFHKRLRLAVHFSRRRPSQFKCRSAH